MQDKSIYSQSLNWMHQKPLVTFNPDMILKCKWALWQCFGILCYSAPFNILSDCLHIKWHLHEYKNYDEMFVVWESFAVLCFSQLSSLSNAVIHPAHQARSSKWALSDLHLNTDIFLHLLLSFRNLKSRSSSLELSMITPLFCNRHCCESDAVFDYAGTRAWQRKKENWSWRVWVIKTRDLRDQIVWSFCAKQIFILVWIQSLKFREYESVKSLFV